LFLGSVGRQLRLLHRVLAPLGIVQRQNGQVSVLVTDA
jgi:hypothetical protein